jgi:hypothetical protein
VFNIEFLPSPRGGAKRRVRGSENLIQKVKFRTSSLLSQLTPPSDGPYHKAVFRFVVGCLDGLLW